MKTKAKKRLKSKKSTFSRITKKEGLNLFKNADLLGLGMMADNARQRLHPEGVVTFIIDRNINYTNICINHCSFCAFWRDQKDPESYILSRRKMFNKIKETVNLGGTQILIQGGLHPDLDIDYYVELLSAIKKKFTIHIHGFSPPEICYMADRAGFTVRKTINILREAGLDSIPGGGAEILSDRVRKKISPKKIGKKRWLKTMEEAHRIGMKTTATMMFGSIEESEDIIEHLDAIRTLQDKTRGFTAFIPWSFQPGNTELQGSGVRGQRSEVKNNNSSLFPATAVEYLRVLALARIYLDNVPNIQASWVTQGLKLAQIALKFGANDFGSTMLEENVVASAGVKYLVSINDILNTIRESGFKPAQRDMYYNVIKHR
ncbi:MAG: cyclic dehypoxanthinyl futalosine synthase [Thermodesulfovibrionia bacterium]|nr:MAG: cyclic dehypoxanthinyl futalosine synthase [Thermodesulfovibrionia bacterium]